MRWMTRSLDCKGRGIAQGEIVEESRASLKRAGRKDAVAIAMPFEVVLSPVRRPQTISVSVGTQFEEDLPRVQGDRVQLNRY